MKKVIYVLALFFATMQLTAQEVAPKKILAKATSKECLEYAKKEVEYVEKICGLSLQQKEDLLRVLENKYKYLSKDQSVKNIETVNGFVVERMRLLLGAEKFEKLALQPSAIVKLTGLVYLNN